MSHLSHVAVIANQEGLDAQGLLASAVAAWGESGLKVVGVLAEGDPGDAACSAGFLRDLASGRKFSIQLDSPPSDARCHLYVGGLENAGANLLAQIPAADVVVLSKFGKSEVAHRGLWPAFQAAVAAGKPLLTTVSSRHDAAWDVFAPDAARLVGDQASIMQWWRAVTGA